ncbi:Acetyltransferase [Dirofilaria immitis]|nr:Acetyltransferase [Dirofilaria immitis]
MKLEPFKEVLKRQIPIEIGKPIPMIVYNIDHPKNCGDPWIGAYSKHGFWYKFSNGNELLGSIMITYLNNIAIIGLYYIIEEYRHSASYLANKCYRFDFTKSFLQQQQQQQQWKFATYEISNPSGFPTLQNNNITTIKYNNLSNIEFYQLSKYDNNLTQLNRDIWLKEWFKREHFNTYIAFNENKVIGYGCSREVAGGYVLPLLNPENDYDWDPDIYAIYRRNVYFIIPEQNTQMIALMEKLKGEGGMIKKIDYIIL